MSTLSTTNLKNPSSGSNNIVLDSSGRVLVGTSTSLSSYGINGLLNVASNGLLTRDASFSYFKNDIYGPILTLAKSRSDSIGTFTYPTSGDLLGTLAFSGAHTGNGRFDLGVRIDGYANQTWTSTAQGSYLTFSTTADGASSPTERMRITSGGYLKATSSGSYTYSANATHEFVNNNSGSQPVLRCSHTDASAPFGVYVNYTGGSPNNTSSPFFFGGDSTTTRFAVNSNGGIANYQANDTNLSDRNAKKDITPAADTWNCLKEWEIVNYRYKDQPDDADLNLGVIAQQVAESCPEVITIFQEAKEATEDAPAQEERLGVKEQQMYWMAIKALQEAQIRIEQLEAKVTALESQ